MPERSTDARAFLAARDFLLAHRTAYADAQAGFRWPRLERFNWGYAVARRAAPALPRLRLP